MPCLGWSSTAAGLSVASLHQEPSPRTQRQRASDDSCCTAPSAARGALGAVECLSRLDCVRALCRLRSPSGLVALAGGRARHGPGHYSAAIAAARCSDPRGCAATPALVDATLPPAACSERRCEMRDLGCRRGFWALGRRCGAPRPVAAPGRPSARVPLRTTGAKRKRSQHRRNALPPFISQSRPVTPQQTSNPNASAASRHARTPGRAVQWDG
jgi:hypothetical protein